MHFPTPNIPPERTPEPPAMVSVMPRSDVLWNRPVFKAPPLEVAIPKFDVQSVADDLRRNLRSEH
jgi:hypothetical protein